MKPLMPKAHWLEVVERAPLISIDLIVQDSEDRVLLGWRTNEPARSTWFVPGGVIRKDEPLNEAFARIAKIELGLTLVRHNARFLGVYEHLYPGNFAEAPGISTHYIVLAHAIRVERLPIKPADAQHRELLGLKPMDLLAHPQVHENTKAYFR